MYVCNGYLCVACDAINALSVYVCVVYLYAFMLTEMGKKDLNPFVVVAKKKKKKKKHKKHKKKVGDMYSIGCTVYDV